MKNATAHLLSAIGVVIVLVLISFNFKIYINSQKVLGTQTEINQTLTKSKIFWENFLTKNPTYLPGWVELTRIEKEIKEASLP